MQRLVRNFVGNSAEFRIMRFIYDGIDLIENRKLFKVHGNNGALKNSCF